VLLFDGAGLALFAVTGTQKALDAGLNPRMAAIMGMLSGIGGGMSRDVLVNETSTGRLLRSARRHRPAIKRGSPRESHIGTLPHVKLPSAPETFLSRVDGSFELDHVVEHGSGGGIQRQAPCLRATRHDQAG
jgi:hypothetical protein